MLYLIRTFGRGKKTAVKIGYSSQPEKRLTNYYEHNPFYELITTRDGDKLMELKLQLYVESFGLKTTFLNEWFIDSDKVVKLFHEKDSKINKRIWKYRDTLFSSNDFKSNGNKLRRDLYELLKNKFNFQPTKSIIDKEWLRITSTTFLREERKSQNYYKKFL